MNGHCHFSMEPSKLKVEELRKELRNRNLDTSGLKQVLIERLEKALAEERVSESGRVTQLDSSETSNFQKHKEPQRENTSMNNSGEKASTDEELEAVEEKRKRRAERFGVPYVPSKEYLEQKKLIRARRFGEELSTKTEDATEIEEKKRKRAERFGLPPKGIPDKLSKQVSQINETLQTVSTLLLYSKSLIRFVTKRATSPTSKLCEIETVLLL